MSASPKLQPQPQLVPRPITPITPTVARTSAAVPAPNLLSHPDADAGNASRLIALSGSDLRYCHELKSWMVWDGARWQADRGSLARAKALDAMKEFRHQAIDFADAPKTADGATPGIGKLHFATESLNHQRIVNCLRIAQVWLDIPVTALDTHPYLLNFTNGTFDLQSGLLRPHSRADYLTKLCQYPYDPIASCPTFLQFLSRILPNPALVSYLQRAIGYTAFGNTKEKAVFICHGDGNNGKSTLLSVFQHLLADYSCLIRISSLIAEQESANSQADLSALMGRRFVQTSEGDRGQRLAEGTLKSIVQGGGRIKTVPKYSNGIEFDETHKLWMDTNHLPIIRGTDNAIWDRLRPIPFTVTIPKPDRDAGLLDRLLSEAPGILAWMLDGAQEWHACGLGDTPAEVTVAVDTWRSNSDQLSSFLSERCVLSGHVFADEFFKAYLLWVKTEGERYPYTRKELLRKLESVRGIEKRRVTAGFQYRGVSLRSGSGGLGVRGGRAGCTPEELVDEED